MKHPINRKLMQEVADELGHRRLGVVIGLARKCTIELYRLNLESKGQHWDDFWDNDDLKEIRSRDPTDQEIRRVVREIDDSKSTIMSYYNKGKKTVAVLREYLERLKY
jgi:hypothetical protein